MRDYAFDVAGPTGAHALVLMHGVTANRKMWLPHTPLLADRYRVIALDLPGHGVLTGIPFRLDSAVDMLERIVGGDARHQALLVGDSLGGYVAMAFADRHPRMAAALVLASCTLPVRGAVAIAARIGANVMSWSVSACLGESLMVRRVAARLQVLAPLLKASLLVRARPDAFRELAGKDFLGMFRRFPGPALLLNGERDVPFRLGERRFLRAGRNARLQIIERAGHTASLDRPEVYSAAIRGFAESIGW